MASENLLAGPPETLLPDNPGAREALSSGNDAADVAARFPAYSAAWAALAERAMRNGDAVTAYAYARTGYHRGLDQLRRAGWRGNGPVPWQHEPNRGFLRSLHMLGVAAAAIGEDDEASRCSQFLRDSSAAAAEELSGLDSKAAFRVISQRKSPCRACAARGFFREKGLKGDARHRADRRPVGRRG